MPYCPKCDMEFIDGITVCTDCGGPLVESEEAAKAMKKQEQEQALARQQKYLDELNEQLQMEQMQKEQENSEESEKEDGDGSKPSAAKTAKPERVKVYVDKAQKYEDLKSSASAFLLVGGIAIVAAILFWTGIINLPMAGASKLLFQSAVTAMGIFSMIVYAKSTAQAKKLQPEIKEEKDHTEELIKQFTDRHLADDLDHEISDREELSEEELSLKRFQIIQDLLITEHDLPDPAYVDALSEEIYSRLYEA